MLTEIKVTKFLFLQVLQKLLAALMRELTKSLKNFLQGQNVSGNFVPKLHYYVQAWGSMWLLCLTSTVDALN